MTTKSVQTMKIRQIGLRMIKTTDAKDRTLSNRMRISLKLSVLMRVEFNTARSMTLAMMVINRVHYINKHVVQFTERCQKVKKKIPLAGVYRTTLATLKPRTETHCNVKMSKTILDMFRTHHYGNYKSN